MFRADDEGDKGNFFALLASAHGAGVAYMLLQHKKQFELKRVSEITVWALEGEHSVMEPWDSETDPDLMMMLKIENVPTTKEG